MEGTKAQNTRAHKGIMRLLPNYFKTLGEGPAIGMERGANDAQKCIEPPSPY